jgi:hypothetical protein
MIATSGPLPAPTAGSTLAYIWSASSEVIRTVICGCAALKASTIFAIVGPSPPVNGFQNCNVRWGPE